MNWKSGTLAAFAGVGMLSACATAPNPPNDLFAQAQSSIEHAQDANAAQAAPVEMRSAETKLQAAKDLAAKATKDSDESEMQQARWLAAESKADVEVAIAKAQAVQATAATTEVQKSNDALQQSLTRNSNGAN